MVEQDKRLRVQMILLFGINANDNYILELFG